MTDKNDREIMQQALYAMMDAMRVSGGISDKMFESVNAISERLAQPKREWQKLTENEMKKLADTHLKYQPESYEVSGVFDLIRAVSEKLEEKNT